jgi:2-polyprenyl-3-methyl-5-hydroxy-6-metoxy-1,4-benzoquinol methylase
VPMDPIHLSQLYLRRAGSRLRGSTLESTRLDAYDDAQTEQLWDSGRAQVAMLTRRMEAVGDPSLSTRRALDFGCGVGRMTLPLAERCAHVYGVDISPAVLRQADEAAQARNVTNVEWLQFERLQELQGRYDMVVSMYVFQHIPSREGERIFTTLVRGLAAGGIGAIDFTIRPGQPLKGWGRKVKASVRSPSGLARALDLTYPYHVMYSYSLNRLGRILAGEGISEWHVRWDAKTNDGVTAEAATLFFAKR